MVCNRNLIAFFAHVENRSVPVDTVLPHVTYKDLPRAILWLTSGSDLSSITSVVSRYPALNCHYARTCAAGASIVEELHETV